MPQEEPGSTARPRPYDGFQGHVGRSFARSTPWWPSEGEPPLGPNVVVMLVDDMGYSDIGCFGSEVPTPHLDRLADEGLRYTNFHATPKCSPTRASLFTGINHHLAGYADVVHFDPGYPSYTMQLDRCGPNLAERFQAAGYATMMVGKWHLAKEAHMSVDGPRDSWPLQRGFDEFYGFLDGFTNLHEPHRMVDGNSILSIDSFPPDYYLTDDLTDRAIRMVADRKVARPERPFFLYFAHAAVHAPLLARTAEIERHRGRYDDGWDVVRAVRYARQLELGVIPAHAVLPDVEEPGLEVQAWDSLSLAQQRIYARYMEVYAAMISSVDANFGRLRSALESMGEWDNTVVLFMSDNGASSEGAARGSVCYFNEPELPGVPPSPSRERLRDPDFQLSRLDRIGLADSVPHYPRGWARVSNTPFRLFKRQTHAGGHQVPAILSYPRGVTNRTTGLRRQYVHVIDVLPTLLDLAGVACPDLEDLDGQSFAPSINDETLGGRKSQYYEMDGNRGFVDDGWEVVARYDPTGRYAHEAWELYHLDADPTETEDLAHAHPERVEVLGDAWEGAAWANQVFPLSDASGLEEVSRPPSNARFEQPVTIWRGATTLDRYHSRLLVQMRSFDVDVALASPWERHQDGVLVSHGDQGGGYLLYVEDGHLRFAHTFAAVTQDVDVMQVPEGVLGFGMRFVASPGATWTVTVAGGSEQRCLDAKFDMFWGVTPFQGIDLGIARRSPVSWNVRARHGTFPFSGDIQSATYTPGALAPESPYLQPPEVIRAAFLEMSSLHD